MLLLFGLAVAGVVLATDFLLLLVLGFQGINPGGLLRMSLVVVAAIALGSAYRIASVRSGGAAVARGLGAVPVSTDTTSFAYRRLRNVVEELAIASGVPVPEVFVLEEEAGINAFAAGFTPADAAITVTRGALDKLTRDELQGVIGHEFSHVLNGDMRLNLRLLGVVFGILVLAIVGRKVAQVSGRSRLGAPGVVMFGLTLYAVGYIGVILARVVKAAIARQREFLADASAVQFTRQTDGIAGALKKIGALVEGSRLAGSDIEEVAHMMFCDGIGLSAALATHPPLVERIKRLDPAFDPGEFKVIAAAWAQPAFAVDDPDRADVSISGFAPTQAPAGATSGRGRVPGAKARVRVSPAGVAKQVGNPANDDQRAAHDLHGAIPARLREAARRPEQALTLVLALLLADVEPVRLQQLALIQTQAGRALRDATLAFRAELTGLHPMQRLPLAALAFPALRRRPRPQLDMFMGLTRALIESDGRVTLDEYCLATLLRIQVMDALDPGAVRVFGRTRLPRIAVEVQDVLAILAKHGNEDEAGARRAYAMGLREVLPDSTAPYAPPRDWVQALDHALPRLDLLAPAGKELVVRALTCAIGADGVVSVAEAELLRTLCAALHCPLPPLLQEAPD